MKVLWKPNFEQHNLSKSIQEHSNTAKPTYTPEIVLNFVFRGDLCIFRKCVQFRNHKFRTKNQKIYILGTAQAFLRA